MNFRLHLFALAFTLLASCSLPVIVEAVPAIASAEPLLRTVHVRDLDGDIHAIPDTTAQATVVVFIAHDCPISCVMLPEIERIRKDNPTVPFYVIYAEPGFSAVDARLHARQYAIGSPCVVANWQQLVEWSGAHVTPEAMIIARGGRLVYDGRVDNLYAGLGQYRAAATTHDLRDALDDVMHGQRVRVPRTNAVGCTIETMLLRGNS